MIINHWQEVRQCFSLIHIGRGGCFSARTGQSGIPLVHVFKQVDGFGDCLFLRQCVGRWCGGIDGDDLFVFRDMACLLLVGTELDVRCPKIGSFIFRLVGRVSSTGKDGFEVNGIFRAGVGDQAAVVRVVIADFFDDIGQRFTAFGGNGREGSNQGPVASRFIRSAGGILSVGDIERNIACDIDVLQPQQAGCCTIDALNVVGTGDTRLLNPFCSHVSNRCYHQLDAGYIVSYGWQDRGQFKVRIIEGV